jgi:hypothetical protein
MAITTNTFTETLRQPIYGVVIGITLLFFVFSPALTMFTMDNDTSLLKDIGLSMLLVAGLFLAVFTSATVVTEEIENKTVLTVLSKTVRRSTFVLGKYLGIAGAVLLAEYILGIVYLLVSRVGVEMAAYEEKVDFVVEVFGGGSILLVLIVGLAGNYLYQWRFTSAAVWLMVILGTINLIIAFFFDQKWNFNPAENHMSPELIGPIFLTMLAVLVITAIALAAATRLSMVMTLLVCVVFFVVGIMLAPLLGPIAQENTGWAGTLSWLGLGFFPCLNYFIVTNAIYNEIAVPPAYLGQTAFYAFLYIAGVLMFAIALFRHREVG